MRQHTDPAKLHNLARYAIKMARRHPKREHAWMWVAFHRARQHAWVWVAETFNYTQVWTRALDGGEFIPPTHMPASREGRPEYPMTIINDDSEGDQP